MIATGETAHAGGAPCPVKALCADDRFSPQARITEAGARPRSSKLDTWTADRRFLGRAQHIGRRSKADSRSWQRLRARSSPRPAQAAPSTTETDARGAVPSAAWSWAPLRPVPSNAESWASDVRFQQCGREGHQCQPSLVQGPPTPSAQTSWDLYVGRPHFRLRNGSPPS